MLKKMVISWLYVLLMARLTTAHVIETRTRLVKDKLENYTVEVHPTPTVASLIDVKINFRLLSLIEIKEKEQSMTTSGWLKVTWNDSRLAWNMNDYNVSGVYFKQKSIWLPDIVNSNSLKEIKAMGYDDLLTYVTYEGVVEWYPGDTYITKCEMDITKFPFDSQICKITVSVWMSALELKLSLSDTDAYVNPTAHNSLWDIIDVFKELRRRDDFYTDVVDIVVILQRRSTFYILNIFLPVVCISALIPLVFILPADLGDRVGVTITILLSFVVFLTILSDNLPKTSRQTSYLTMYMTTLLILSGISVALSIITLKISSLPDTKPTPSSLMKNNKTCPLPKDARPGQGENLGRPDDDVDPRCSRTWKDVANALDIALAVLFSLIFLSTSATVFYLIVSGTR